MDVGYYISELLGQHGDVNVPGLGYFAHTRVNGYYNNREGRFYPPGYSVQFDPQFLDDDALAIHIAEKKKISVASSNYFIEKFVFGLKQQALTGEAALAELGWFSTNSNTQLIFKPNNISSTDPEFFGYPTITLQKIGHQPAEPEAQNEDTEGTSEVSPPVTPHQQQVNNNAFETDQEHEAYIMELTTAKRRKSKWIFIVLALLFTAAGIFLTQRYDPAAFNFFTTPKEKPPVAPTIIMATDDTVAAKKDTDTVPLVRNIDTDSVALKTTALANASLRPRFELIDGAFKSMKSASAAILQFKQKGVDQAKIVNEPGTGKLIKISIGTFATRGEAEDGRKEMMASKKASLKAYIIEINPQTTGIKP